MYHTDLRWRYCTPICVCKHYNYLIHSQPSLKPFHFKGEHFLSCFRARFLRDYFKGAIGVPLNKFYIVNFRIPVPLANVSLYNCNRNSDYNRSLDCRPSDIFAVSFTTWWEWLKAICPEIHVIAVFELTSFFFLLSMFLFWVQINILHF